MKKLLSPDELDFFFTALQEMYPQNESELNWSTPRQLLVAVVLSAQTTDKQVNKVTSQFFNQIKTPYDTLSYSPENRYQLIKSVNYAPTKAKHLYQTAQLLTTWKAAPDYTIPNTEQELTKLPWVGVKTAKVILFVLYDTDDIAVDTHVHRVCNRMRIVQTNSPLQTSKLLPERIPDKYKKIAHHALIYFGRYRSKARNILPGWKSFEDFKTYYYTSFKKYWYHRDLQWNKTNF